VPEVKGQIAFDHAGLGSILRQYLLTVPANQREYSWTDREVKQLFQDFAKAIGDDDAHFLGTIVTIPRLDGSLEVVDGQQRLATTAILLGAIRDYLGGMNEEIIIESINNEFLTGIDRQHRARVPKLRLNLADNELFGRIITRELGDIEADPMHPSHALLVRAYELAQEHVKSIVAGFDKKDHGDLLNRWVTFIQDRALVVLLRVPDDSDAFKMFETLNDRGLRTSQVDLIKNHLFGRAKARIGEVQTRWAYMRGALESLGEEDITINFLRHALIAMDGYLREVDIYDRVQTMVKSDQAAVAFANKMEGLSNAYAATFNTDHERWNSYPDRARRSVEVINLFNIHPLRPLVLAVAHKMEQNEATKTLEFIVALGVRLMIASSTRSGSVEQPLAAVAEAVFKGTITKARQVAEDVGKLVPADHEFQASFAQARVANTNLAKYYLRSLEMTAKGEPEPWFIPQDDKQVVNLEHVLPKKPDDNWPTFSDEEVRLYSTRLGNLALLRKSDNSALRSSAFAEKKPAYAKCPYLLTSQIGELDAWTPETIVQRQTALAALAIKTWPAKP